jgi:O-methyltransferase domain/Dimerisation domain
MSRSTISTAEARHDRENANTVDPGPLHEILFAPVVAQIVYAAAELKIADLLAAGPMTNSELASRTGSDPHSLWRLMRALAGIGVVVQTEDDRFELTDVGRPLKADTPGSMHALVSTLCGPEYWRSLAELVPSVLPTGESGWRTVHGLSWIESLERDPEQFATFNAAMSEHTRDAAPALIAQCELSRFHTVVDVGGGDGTLIAEMLRSHQDLEGILFDLPDGLASADATLRKAGVADRCRVTEGDFFLSVPTRGDAYVLKQILHDWDDEHATAILRTCRDAMSPEGRILILERMLPERAGTTDLPILLVDVLMLAVTGGRERTEAQFRDLLAGAGFTLTRCSPPLPPFNYRVLEGTPA